MRLIHVVLLVFVVVGANAAKVSWDSNGKPIIAKSNKPVKGCNRGSFEDIVKDKNSTKPKCH